MSQLPSSTSLTSLSAIRGTAPTVVCLKHRNCRKDCISPCNTRHTPEQWDRLTQEERRAIAENAAVVGQLNKSHPKLCN